MSFLDSFPDKEGAWFSVDRKRRYALIRCIDKGHKETKLKILFVVCQNPSTADETSDDTTTTNLITTARELGCNRLIIVNRCPIVETKYISVKALKASYPDNEAAVSKVFSLVKESSAEFEVLYAWGNRCGPESQWLKSIRENMKFSPKCYWRNKTGCPKHPSRMRNSDYLQLIDFFQIEFGENDVACLENLYGFLQKLKIVSANEKTKLVDDLCSLEIGEFTSSLRRWLEKIKLSPERWS